ncbi:MAG: hypothetical protein LBU70_06690 [Chitinispirillales bacterium]|jgi:hypothetical protein|nr:hypothetical protein [Chitinispirillales bacterium]
MESTREKAFYDTLSIVPDVPEQVFANVERSVRISGVKRRTLLAACLLLAFIVPAFVIWQLDTSTVSAKEYTSMDELMYALEFLIGDENTDYDYLFDIDIDVADDDGNGKALTMSGNRMSVGDSRGGALQVHGKERSNED